MNLAWTVFVGAFMNVFIPWVLSREFTQEIIRNQTEIARAAKNATVRNDTWTISVVGEL